MYDFSNRLMCEKGEYDKAIELLEKTLEIWIKTPEGNEEMINILHGQLGTLSFKRGDLVQANHHWQLMRVSPQHTEPENYVTFRHEACVCFPSPSHLQPPLNPTDDGDPNSHLLMINSSSVCEDGIDLQAGEDHPLSQVCSK